MQTNGHLFAMTQTLIGVTPSIPMAISHEEWDFSEYHNTMLAVCAIGTAILGMQLALDLADKLTQFTEQSEKARKVLPSKRKAPSKPSGSEQNILTGERPRVFPKAPASKSKRQARQRRQYAHIDKHPNLMDRKTRRIKGKFPINQPANRR